EKVAAELNRKDSETAERFNQRVRKKDYNELNNKNRATNPDAGIGGSRKFSTFSNSTKHSFSNGKLRLYLYRPTSYPRVGDKDFGKTSFKSYSTYSRNILLPSVKLKDGDKKLNNKNIFLKRAIYNFIKA
ncbi:hypothetical protein PX554_26565, partial [Sphingomonas sp. H39-1-10]|uniref:hypothetical protein n=1 Tax=Sphingomonas pollutisoli TaxID=3030829 RepID=UPI0023B8BEDA